MCPFFGLLISQLDFFVVYLTLYSFLKSLKLQIFVTLSRCFHFTFPVFSFQGTFGGLERTRTSDLTLIRRAL